MQCDPSTVWRLCRRYEQGGLTGSCWTSPRWAVPPEISPLQRAQIVELACLEPVAEGLHITHWSSDDLARQAVADGIVPAISPATVRRILQRCTCNRTARDTGGPPASMSGSRIGPRRSSGAMPTPCAWPAGDLDRRRSTRSPTSKSWSATRSGAEPGLDRATGIRVHPPRHGQPVVVPGRPHRPDGGRRSRQEDAEHYIEQLRASAAAIAGCGGLPDPGRRPQPHVAATRRPTGRVAGAGGGPASRRRTPRG